MNNYYILCINCIDGGDQEFVVSSQEDAMGLLEEFSCGNANNIKNMLVIDGVTENTTHVLLFEGTSHLPFLFKIGDAILLRTSAKASRACIFLFEIKGINEQTEEFNVALITSPPDCAECENVSFDRAVPTGMTAVQVCNAVQGVACL